MIKKFLCFLFLTGLFFTVSVSAQPELDTTFRSTGKAVLQFGTIGNTEDMVVQPDNKIILVGACSSINVQNATFCVIRLNADGTFDSTFGAPQGTSGYVYVRGILFGMASPGSAGVALQNDGKIVVASSTGGSMTQATLIRFNSDGSMDSSFGTNGIVRTTVNGNDRASKVMIQPDGKILAVGTSGTSGTSSSNYKQILIRYLPNGAPDNSFGSGGAVTIDVPGNVTSGSSIAQQPDGKIITGGSMSTGGSSPTSYFLITRLLTDGSPDTSFDGDGFKSIVSGTSLFPGSGVLAVAVQSDGQILALGETNILYRFNPDGSPDTSFDTDGSRQALNGDSNSHDLVVTPSGKITVVGTPNVQANFPNLNYRVARYLSSGAPDTSFSTDGFLDIDLDSSLDGADSVTLDPQGKIVLGGRTTYGGIVNAPWNYAQFSAARLLAQPTQNVGFSGRVTDSGGKPIVNAYISLSNGSGIIGYSRTNNFGYFRFANVPSSQTYTLSTYSKGLNYYERRVLVDDEITNFLVVGGK